MTVNHRVGTLKPNWRLCVSKKWRRGKRRSSRSIGKIPRPVFVICIYFIRKNRTPDGDRASRREEKKELSRNRAEKGGGPTAIRAVQGTKLECTSVVSSGCARFSRKAVTRRLTAALLPAAVCLLAFFGFVGILYFLPACLIIITRQHTHAPLKKKAGAHTHPQNLPKKRETTSLKTDVFLPLFSAHTRTDGRTDGRTHGRTHTQKIKGHWTQLLLYKKKYTSFE